MSSQQSQQKKQFSASFMLSFFFSSLASAFCTGSKWSVSLGALVIGAAIEIEITKKYSKWN